MGDSIPWAIAIALAYVAGSIPFGFLLAKSRGVDIREHGSGNIGATNVRRVLGKKLGNLCFALDLLKGALPTLIAGFALGPIHAGETLSATTGWLWLGVAVATVAGHMFPIFLNFKGGKGVATGFGAMLALWPHTTVPALIALGVWLAALKTWRMVSVASCLAAISLPISVIAMRLIGWPGGGLASAIPFIAVTAALAALVLLRHRANLARVRAGTEPRVMFGTGAGGQTGEKSA